MRTIRNQKTLQISIIFLIFVFTFSMLWANSVLAGEKPSSWAEGTINKAKAYGLITTKVMQDYQGHITREEFCELVMKLYEATSDEPAQPASPNPFTDTENPYVLKAYNLKIVSGYGEGIFAPNEKITREQLACMFNNYLMIGFDFENEPPELQFNDKNQVSNWALQSVKRMVSSGIIGGVGNNMLQPKGYATREQAVILVVRVYELVCKLNGVEPVNNSDSSAQAIDSQIKNRTKEEVMAKWNELKPRYTGKPFQQAPVVNAPYSIGKVNASYLQDGLNLVNFYRYLVGLPSDLVIDEDLTTKAQYAAVLQAAVDYGGHYPDKPADMNNDFYNIGKAASKTSNLFYYSGSANDNNKLVMAVHNWMHDGVGERNIKEVAHRRWILYAPVLKTGFGFTKEPSNYGEANYLTMYTQDKSRGQKVDYDFLAWPSPGYVPLNFINQFIYQGSAPYPWSVFINPEKYKAPDFNKVKIIVTRKNDNKTWYLDKNDDVDYMDLYAGTEYFNIKNISYGVKYIIVFAPGKGDQFAENEEFEVKITGLETKDGQSAVISYNTKFFTLK